MLSHDRKAFFKELLSRMLDELLGENHSSVEQIEMADQRIPDPSDRATAESEFEFRVRIRERNKGLIRKIEKALGRIADGTFGICEECEEEIAEGRLKARPVTTLCIACKTRQEADERLREL